MEEIEYPISYFILLTGDGSAYGSYNLTLTVTPIYPTQRAPFMTPWHLDRIDQRNLPLNNQYSVTDNAEDIFVYLIDSGVNSQHEELQGRVIVGYDFVRWTGTDTPDCTGHGTHNAALIAGRTYGVAKSATIISVRVYGCDHKTSKQVIVDALNWVLTHSKRENYRERSIIALMVSINQTESPIGDTPDPLPSIIDGLVLEQFPVIVPAGDLINDIERKDACEIYPANEQNFLTVGATARTSDRRAVFTNIGPCVNLYAPGASITSAWHSSDTAVVTMSGSAQAAAIVAGTVALLLSININLKGPALNNILFSVGTPDVIPEIDEDDIARLVFVRSVDVDRKVVPTPGFVTLQALLRATLSSCEASVDKIDALKETLANALDLGSQLQNVNIKCQRVTFLQSEAVGANNISRKQQYESSDIISKSKVLKNEKNNQMVNMNIPSTLRQTGDFDLELTMFVEERKASLKFLMLERTLSGEGKINVESELGFAFQVVEMPWATDSHEVIYWGAPTFPDTPKERLTVGVIIAIVMCLLLVVTVVGVGIWLWHRRVNKLDEIKSMEGSADMERGPIHFRDYENENLETRRNRSFRNFKKSLSFRNGVKGKNENEAPPISSLGSFVRRTESKSREPVMLNNVRLQSFGGEAFAGTSPLNDDEEEEENESGSPSWRGSSTRSTYSAQGFGRINSQITDNGKDEGNDAAQRDRMVVKSMGGEAFAMFLHTQSVMENHGRGGRGETGSADDRSDTLDENLKRGNSNDGSIKQRSDVEALKIGFMNPDVGERIIKEDDLIAMTPKNNAARGFQN